MYSMIGLLNFISVNYIVYTRVVTSYTSHYVIVLYVHLLRIIQTDRKHRLRNALYFDYVMF